MGPIEKLHFDFSIKNIPLTSEKAYRKKLVKMTEKFISRLHWDAYFRFEKEGPPMPKRETYGFKTAYKPPRTKTFEKFISTAFKYLSSLFISC